MWHLRDPSEGTASERKCEVEALNLDHHPWLTKLSMPQICRPLTPGQHHVAQTAALEQSLSLTSQWPANHMAFLQQSKAITCSNACWCSCPRNEADRHALNKHPMPGDNDATLTAWHISGKHCSLSMGKKSVLNSASCLPQQVPLGQLLRQLFVQQLPQWHADLGSLEQTAQTGLSVSAWSGPVRRH